MRLFEDRPDEGAVLELIDLSDDDAIRVVPFAPPRPRETIAVNGSHSDHEALAFDLRSRGMSYEEMAVAMECDVQTIKTYILRARVKNRRDAQMEEALRLSVPSD
ncbi:sigma factor-like helix-turn-helix DNA-binding protein [Pleomorphomonas sp. PLEO]|uniref:sigma factor-like helix-turn-helix DNA-binding protein n=1 Tax=Pleomorphomonas sp. PLEO TaxID=3239306 RepID=UPI00351EE1A4